MKQAILLVGHGSRDPEGNEELLAFAGRVREQLAGEYPVVETCFLEFAKPNIAQGIANCISGGATQVTVVPIILFGAGHSKLHIPHEIDEARERYPDVAFAYGKPIGVHPLTLEILAARLREAGYAWEAGQERSEDAILIVGRGSSDPDANSDLMKVSRLLWERVPVRYVETCYIGVTQPDFAEGMRRCVSLGAKRVYVLPYFLFTGVLIKRMETMLLAFSGQYPEVPMQLAGYFGFHDALIEILRDRVEEAARGEVKMNCENCQFRLAAMEGHHHDHDHDHDHDHEHEHDHSTVKR